MPPPSAVRLGDTWPLTFEERPAALVSRLQIFDELFRMDGMDGPESKILWFDDLADVGRSDRRQDRIGTRGNLEAGRGATRQVNLDRVIPMEI
jgi:hypothetical protein